MRKKKKELSVEEKVARIQQKTEPPIPLEEYYKRYPEECTRLLKTLAQFPELHDKKGKVKEAQQ